VKGVRAAGWGAAGAVAVGVAAAALVAALVPAHRAPEAIGGATYASVAAGRVHRLLVTSLRTGGDEVRAGLKVGDEVAAVDGTAAPSFAVLRRELTSGHPVALTVRRDGDAIPLTLLQRGRETRFDEDSADRGR
jgi:S1-C subfamily serine protease